jgi:hypothetical protein
MSKMFALATALLLCALPALADKPAQVAQPWEMTVTQFRSALDRAIKADGKAAAGAEGCKADPKDKTTTVCSFDDASFKQFVALMVERGLMLRGHFPQDLSIRFSATQGKVSEIVLNGRRSDPANLMAFVGTALNVLQVFQPNVVADRGDLNRVTESLGLLRGDSAADVGKPRTLEGTWGIAQCLTLPSQVSAKVTCTYKPKA